MIAVRGWVTLAGAAMVLAMSTGVGLTTGDLPRAGATPCDAVRQISPGFPCLEAPSPTQTSPVQEPDTSAAAVPQASVPTVSPNREGRGATGVDGAQGGGIDRTPTAAAPEDLDQKLGRFARLLKQGKLTDAEFRDELERLINCVPPQAGLGKAGLAAAGAGRAQHPTPIPTTPTPTRTPTPKPTPTPSVRPQAAEESDSHHDPRLLLLPLSVAVGLVSGATWLWRRRTPASPEVRFVASGLEAVGDVLPKHLLNESDTAASPRHAWQDRDPRGGDPWMVPVRDRVVDDHPVIPGFDDIGRVETGVAQLDTDADIESSSVTDTDTDSSDNAGNDTDSTDTDSTDTAGSDTDDAETAADDSDGQSADDAEDTWTAYSQEDEAAGPESDDVEPAEGVVVESPEDIDDVVAQDIYPLRPGPDRRSQAASDWPPLWERPMTSPPPLPETPPTPPPSAVPTMPPPLSGPTPPPRVMPTPPPGLPPRPDAGSSGHGRDERPPGGL